MPSCLGIYVDENLIKYAKVQKEKDSIKVEAFNIEFYENLEETLTKIINETNSEKTPISINVSNELYNYFDVFAMLSKKDIKKSVDIEFEEICNNRQYNKDSLETRYVLMKSMEEQERYRVLHIAANKIDINKKLKGLSKCKINSLTPISTSITNLIEVNPKDNIAIINLENETKITTVIEGQIYRVDILEEGMGKVFDEINRTENSMKKTYEICKNITIYTQETQTLNSEDSEHLEDVMPTLYKIVTESKKIIDSSFGTISKVYITGLGTAINNVDLYFQEYMMNVKCEVLKPFFTQSSSVKIPIKEYIEVNSAIALALDGLGCINKELNFLTNSKMTLDKDTVKNLFSVKGKKAISGPLHIIEKLMFRGITAALILLMGYISFSSTIINRTEEKSVEVTEATVKVVAELNSMDLDLSKINSQTQSYTTLINAVKNLEKTAEEIQTSRVINKDAIPNLLNRIMFVIPQKVKISSIKNTTSNHIVIEAEAEKYEQLGYFRAILTTEKILVNVTSTSGSKSDSVVQVTIEGDLP